MARAANKWNDNDLQISKIRQPLKADNTCILKGKWSVTIHSHTIWSNKLLRFGWVEGQSSGRIRVVLNRIIGWGEGVSFTRHGAQSQLLAGLLQSHRLSGLKQLLAAYLDFWRFSKWILCLCMRWQFFKTCVTLFAFVHPHWTKSRSSPLSYDSRKG